MFDRNAKTGKKTLLKKPESSFMTAIHQTAEIMGAQNNSSKTRMIIFQRQNICLWLWNGLDRITWGRQVQSER